MGDNMIDMEIVRQAVAAEIAEERLTHCKPAALTLIGESHGHIVPVTGFFL
jgi:hypothetical protein